jgi:hypothetical protein
MNIKSGGKSVVALIILLAAVLSIIVTCDKGKIVEPTPGILYGLVVDSITSVPIESAAIYPYDISSVPKYTDSTGYYALPLMAATGVTIICQKTGYDGQIKQGTIVASESTRVDFHLVLAR